MKSEIKKALSDLADSTVRLEEACRSAKTQLERDGLVKRFEFTYELLWKTLKIFVEYSGWPDPLRGPREVLEAALKRGFLNDGKVYFEMLKDRNITAHLYSEEEATKVISKIRKEYAKAIRKVLTELQNKQVKGRVE